MADLAELHVRGPSLAFVTAPAQDASERRGIHVAAAVGIVASLIALVAILGTDAGAPWSAENMAMILVPPLALGALLLVAMRTSIAAGRAWSIVSRALLGTTWVLFAVSLILVPVGLFGAWMDSGIG